MRAWTADAPVHARHTHAPYALVRGEHEARVNKAARCRQRLAATARQLYADARHAPAADELARLHRDETRLRAQTRVQDTLRGVLLDRTVGAYLPDASPRQAKRRVKNLMRLRLGPLGRPRQAGAASAAIRGALESAIALEATATPVKRICGHYLAAHGKADGRVSPSAPLVQDLIGLLDRMNMLRGQDQDPADFLYPAVKLMYEANRGAAAGDAMLHGLLRDLKAERDNPRGLRAALHQDKRWLDFWLAANAPEAYDRDPAAARRGLAAAIDKLLDGLAGAAGTLLREQLRTQVPAWAGEAQAPLFKEAALLHASIQRWHDRGVAQDSQEPLLQWAPAETVRLLLEHAANDVLGTSAAPPAHVAPLLCKLRVPLGQIAARIQRTLDQHRVAEHASAAEIDELRQSLMLGVLEETGILGETYRLRSTRGMDTPKRADARADKLANDGVDRSANKPLATTVARGARLSSRTYQARAARRADAYAKHVRKPEKQAQRAIAKLLDAGARANGKPLSPHKLEALREARATLASLYGDAAPAAWRRLVDSETLRLKDRQLRALNMGALHAHVRGVGSLTATVATVADGAARAESEQLLAGVWSSIRAATARRNAGPYLRTWCASLQATGGVTSAMLPLQLHGLRERIGMLADNQVKTPILLDAALREVGDAELGVLIHALATGLPASADSSMHAFMDDLVRAARSQAARRMDALRDSLMADFGPRLFEHAGALETLLDKPDMLAANGSLPGTLQQLVRDAALFGRLAHEHGARAASVRMGARYLRTPNGYDLAQDLAHGLCREISGLHARLDDGMKVLGIARFQPGAITAAWREHAVEQILEETGIWDELNAVARRLPREPARKMDMPRLWAAATGTASLERDGVRASTRSTRSVGADGYAKTRWLFGKRRAAATVLPAAPAVAAPIAPIPPVAPVAPVAPTAAVATVDADTYRYSTEGIYATISDVTDIGDVGDMGSVQDSDRASTLAPSVDSGYDTLDRKSGWPETRATRRAHPAAL
ncbi:hypothetical protein CAL26_15035 [Bordetella genomosp. 9]|uniref:Uncharacterized protein n=1 Tax=Bordetella genomosp. 9 TaxID=1416803 RepID=A0A261R2W1_9BORD|nr:hypothetical protein [Bordetella genomosp. 9]OZI18982.1 hypothetical protein CAL26_15035 [Bordetella genomosp. 9]